MKVDLENWQVKQLREYFGHNDKTQIAHWAYTVFDKAHKKQLTLTDVSQQRGLLNALADDFNDSTDTYVGQPMIEETLKAFNCG